MDLPRQRLDNLAFALALTALLAAAVGFVYQRNGAAIVMCATSMAGLVAGRIVGISGGVTLTVALGLVTILWIVWVDPISTPRRTTAVAHTTGGALAGWAIAATLIRRRWPTWAAAAIAGVLALTVVWEVAELAGDLMLHTALIPSWRDSAQDILFGCVGGALGIVAGRLVKPPGRSSRHDRLASPR